MKKIIISIIAVLTQFTIFVNAQTTEKPNSGINIFFAPYAFQTQSPAGLNSILTANGLAESEKNFDMLPIFRIATSAKLLVAVEMNFGRTFTKETDKGSVKSQASHYSFQIGYDVLKSEKARLYPTIGFGEMDYSTNLVLKNTTPVTLDKIFANPAAGLNSSVHFSTSSPMLDLGIELQSNNLPARLSLKTGYRLALIQATWKSNHTFTSIPKDNLSHFYVQLGFSLTGMRKAKK